MNETELQIMRETQQLLDERLKLLDAEMATFLHLDGPTRAIETERWFRGEIAKAVTPLLARIMQLETKPLPAMYKPSKQFEDALFGAIGQFIADELRERDARIAKLEERGWKGDFQKALAYPAQSEVRHKGASWVATRDIAPGEVPGEGCTGWQLKDKSPTPPRQATAERTHGL